MMQKSFSLLLAEHRPLFMGILNLTPDSFHDGGRFFSEDAASLQMDRLIRQGADIIDLGGASSRPGFEAVPADEEWRRLSMILDRCQDKDVLFSVDTDRLEIAEKAFSRGVAILNYTGGLLDERFFSLCARYHRPLILMHRLGEEGRHGDIVAETMDFFRQGILLAEQNGLERSQLILDPGPGFGKDTAENVAVLAAVPLYKKLGYPLLMAFSHKRFVARLSGENPGAAPLGNLAAAAYSVESGADILRLHDISVIKAFISSMENGYGSDHSA